MPSQKPSSVISRQMGQVIFEQKSVLADDGVFSYSEEANADLREIIFSRLAPNGAGDF